MPNPVLPLVAAMVLFALSALAFAAAPGGADIMVHVERDGSTFTSTTDFTVAATRDEVWDVLTDFNRMSRILSSVDASKITNREGNKFDVVQKSHGSAGILRISLDSVRQVELAPKREIRSHLVKGDLKSSDFITRITDEGGLVHISVTGKFVTAGLASAAVTVDAVESQTQRQYQELRDEILRRQRHEPTPACILAKNCP